MKSLESNILMKFLSKKSFKYEFEITKGIFKTISYCWKHNSIIIFFYMKLIFKPSNNKEFFGNIKRILLRVLRV